MHSGGKYIGIDWFSKNTDMFLTGIETEEENTKYFSHLGNVSFFDEDILKEVLKSYKIIFFGRKVLLPNGT